LRVSRELYPLSIAVPLPSLLRSCWHCVSLESCTLCRLPYPLILSSSADCCTLSPRDEPSDKAVSRRAEMVELPRRRYWWAMGAKTTHHSMNAMICCYCQKCSSSTEGWQADGSKTAKQNSGSQHPLQPPSQIYNCSCCLAGLPPLDFIDAPHVGWAAADAVVVNEHCHRHRVGRAAAAMSRPCRRAADVAVMSGLWIECCYHHHVDLMLLLFFCVSLSLFIGRCNIRMRKLSLVKLLWRSLILTSIGRRTIIWTQNATKVSNL